ncbi:MAG: Ig-like domain-containing protein [Chloroflexota bacterium]
MGRSKHWPLGLLISLVLLMTIERGALTAAPLRQASGLVISEIMPNPSAVTDDRGEWFEVTYVGGGSLNLNGCTIRDNDGESHVIDNGGPLRIRAGEFLVFGRNDNRGQNGGVQVDYVYSRFFFLANRADEIFIVCNGQERDRVNYNASSFPISAGASMQLLDLGLNNNNAGSWCQSTERWSGSAGDKGSPGRANNCPVDLEISKSASAQTVSPGDQLSYTLTYRNNGPGTTQAEITDIVPGFLTDVSFSSTGPNLTRLNGPNYRWRTSTLAAGMQGQITISGEVEFGVAGGTRIVNVAQIETDTPDPRQNNNSDQVRVTISNEPPVAVDDTAITDEDQAITIAVLNNDHDPNNDDLTIKNISNPAHGTATKNGTRIIYTPDPDFFGDDQFTYQADDGDDSSSATVFVTVDAVNDAPLAEADTASLDEDSTVVISVLENDSDSDGHLNNSSLTVTTQPSHGSVTLNRSAGQLTYTPDPDYHGNDQLEYRVCDNGNPNPALCDIAQVMITINPINDGPIAQPDAYQATEDVTLRVPASTGVLNNDSDIDGDALTAHLVNDVTVGNLNLDENGSFSYTPPLNFNGQTSFSYRNKDSAIFSEAVTVLIQVAAVNDPPVATNDVATTDEDHAVTIDVLNNDTDIEGDTLTLQSAGDPQNGQTTKNGNRIIYTPNADFTGQDTFVYVVQDGQGGTDTGSVVVTIEGVNDPPQARNDEATLNEDASIDIAVLANDNDVDGNVVNSSVAIISNPSRGAANPIGNTGQIRYRPNANYHGNDTLTYQVCDDGSPVPSLCSQAQVDIHIRSVNDPPQAVNDEATTDEDEAVTIPVLQNDSDIDDDPLSIQSVGNAEHGDTRKSGVRIVYTPNDNYAGNDQFTYVVKDGNGGTDTAIVNISVRAINDPPSIRDDTASLVEDTTVDIAVLANDTDIDGDLAPNTLEILISSDHGQVNVIGSMGEIRYAPQANYYGDDKFTYRVCDNGTPKPAKCSTAEVTINVRAVNDIPQANDDTATTDEDEAVTIRVLNNDTDVDGDELKIHTVSASQHGTATKNGKRIVYAPDDNYTGEDSFSYVVKDGNGGRDTAHVFITVQAINDRPTTRDDTASLDEDTTINVPVLDNDNDIDGDLVLSSVIVRDTPTHGQAIPNPQNGIIHYQPQANYYGPDTFTYRVCDNGTPLPRRCNTASVNITVRPINDFPEAIQDEATTNEDLAITIAVLNNDTDIDGDDLSIQTIGTPQNGTTTQDGNQVVYQPSPDFFGEDHFTYQIHDGNGGTDTGDVTISIVAINDAPNLQNDVYTLEEDQQALIAVLANDRDIDGTVLPESVLVVEEASSGATFVLETGEISYQPQSNFYGDDTFIYQACDDGAPLPALCSTAEVHLTVTPVNDAPQAVDDLFTTPEDTPLIVPALHNDEDIDGDSLRVISVGEADVGQVTLTELGLMYTPTPDFFGEAHFDYLVSDGQGGQDEGLVTVIVTAVNDPPFAHDDSYGTQEDTPLFIEPDRGVLQNDGDVDSATLTTILVDDVLTGTLTFNPDGSFIYTPAPEMTGVDHFIYQVRDGELSSEPAQVFIYIGIENDAPTAQDDAVLTDEDQALSIQVLDNDSDLDGQLQFDTLQVITQANQGLATVNTDQGIVYYRPDPDYYGQDQFIYQICDDGFPPPVLCSQALVQIEIKPVNDPPNAIADNYETDEDTSLTVGAIAGPLANDDDIELDPLTALLVRDVLTGNLAFATDGHFVYEPSLNFNGPISFVYQAEDIASGVATATVTILVNPVNDAPIAYRDVYTVDEDTPLNVAPEQGLLANDRDVDSIALQVSLVDDVSRGRLAVTSDGSFTYVPSQNDTGPVVFTYRAQDGSLPSDIAEVSIEINPVNDPPRLISQNALAVTQNSTLNHRIQAIDVDDGDILQITGLDLPNWLTLIDQGNGIATLTGDMTQAELGFYELTLQVDDGQAIDRQVLSIFVAASGVLIHHLYLPFVPQSAPPSGPDLIVQNVTARSNAITVTIQNIGETPIVDDFWVDVYIDPNQIPAYNLVWPAIAPYGVVWGVTTDILPGEIVTLTLYDQFYDSNLSNIEDVIPGTPVWAQVDSANTLTDFGGVLEADETNNILGPIFSMDGRTVQQAKSNILHLPDTLPDR